MNEQAQSDRDHRFRVDGASDLAAEHETGRKLVYVIDDDRLCRSAILRLLVSLGFDAIEFPSAEAFLAYNRDSQNFGHECAIVDHRMSGMSGLELQDVLKNHGDSIPLIFMSGVAEFATAAEAMRNGAVQLLEKPVRATSLEAALQNAFANSARPTMAFPPEQELVERVKLVHRLSRREYEVAQFVTQGLSSKQIAHQLELSDKTIEKYRSNIVKKLGVRSSAEMVRMVVMAEFLRFN